MSFLAVLQRVQTWACILKDSSTFSTKLMIKRGQRKAVKGAVSALTSKNRTKNVDILLSALEKETFLSKNVENVAIRRAFEWDSYCKDDSAFLVKRYFDHPAISAKDYSDALYNSYVLGGKTERTLSLVIGKSRSSRLGCSQKRSGKLSGWPSEFQTAVEKALSKVSLNVRIGIRQRPAVIKRELDEYHLPTVLVNIIIEY